MHEHLLVNRFLTFLEVERKEPTLSFLNELIHQHQKKVKWETFTKMLDWEYGNATGNYIPPIDVYIDRIVNKGMGGTCWTLSVGFHWLLSQLGFHVQYLYMNPGHLCLRVDFDEPYYVDIGYTAPLFQAYPLLTTFQVSNIRETFYYKVSHDSIAVTRIPGPEKTLSPHPVTLDDMYPLLKSSNDWSRAIFLKKIRIFSYINDIPSSLENNVLKQYFLDKKVESVIPSANLDRFISDYFGMDKKLVQKALRIHEEKTKISDCS